MGSHHENSVGNKSKRTWGERLKLGGKVDKKREERSPTSPVSPDSSYFLEEYRTKYGTLSSGSALSKSMKYAETWLYGSVAVRPPSKDSNPRPSLFLYQHVPPPVAVIPSPPAVVFPQAAKYAMVVCSCPEFITGTARSKKNSSATCKKCGGSRTFWNVNKAGTVRGLTSAGTRKCVEGTLRVGTVGHGQNRVRPSLLNLAPLQKSTDSSKSVEQPLKATTPDPYDLMRRNRLGAVSNESQARYELLETSGVDTVRIRAKSTSPCRRRRSPSPPSGSGVERSGLGRTSRRDIKWDREYSRWNSAVVSPDNNNKRKSILECDVNAYELIAKYLKNGNKPPRLNKDGLQNNELEKPLSDDDILEDDLSDDLSDNALENTSCARKNRPFSTFKSKTDNSKYLGDSINGNSVHSTSSVEKCSSPNTRPTGITLGGQRIKIFNESSHSPSDVDKNQETAKTNENSEENNKGKSRQQTSKNANTSSPSLIPRLASPRRPPRKLKTEAGGNTDGVAIEESGENENESAELSSGDKLRGSSPSVLVQTRDARYISTTTEGAIKSILKKPTLSPGDTTTTFSDTVSSTNSPASAASVSCHSPSPAVADSTREFYLPTFQEFKQKIKKKKQVQFKVTDDIALLGPVTEEEEEEDGDTIETAPVITDSLENLTKYSVRNELDNTCRDQNEETRNAIVNLDEKQLNIRIENPVVNENKYDNTDRNCDTVKIGDVDERCDVKLSGGGDVIVKIEREENSAKDFDVKPENSTPAPPDLQDGIKDSPAIPVSSNEENLVKDRESVVTLRRSQSERVLPTTTGSLRGCDSKLQNCVDFNDTMRLRTRPGRPDIRQVFSDPGASGPYKNTNVPKRMLSPGRPRPKEPPPPPPPPSFDSGQDNSDTRLPELPPRQIFPFTKKQIEQMNSQAKQKKTHAVNPKESKSFDLESPVSSEIRPASWSPHTQRSNMSGKLEAGIQNNVKKKEHRHSDPGTINPKLIVHIDKIPQSHLKDSAIQTESDFEDNSVHRENKQSNSLPKMASRIGSIKDCMERTIVTVSSSSSVPGTPLADVHRLRIKTEDTPVNVSPGQKRKTSIIIMNDESPFSISSSIQDHNTPVKTDNTNKVTICVGGDSNPSPIELNSNVTHNTSSSYTLLDTSSIMLNSCENFNQNSSSLTVLSSSNDVNIIPVTQEPVQRTMLVVDQNDSDKRTLQCWVDGRVSNNSDITVVGNTGTMVNNVNNITQEPSSNIIFTYRSRGMDAHIDTEEEDQNILMNPVEAVKRNLIPHVCGKKSDLQENGSPEPSPIERLDQLTEIDIEIDDNEEETMKEGDYCMAAVASKLLETSDDSPLYSNVSSTPTTTSRSSEDTLPTVLEQGEEDDEVFLKTDSPADASGTDNDVDEVKVEDKSPNFVEIDKAPSSTEVENEGTEGNDVESSSTSQHLSENIENEKDNKEEVEVREEKGELEKETHREREDENLYESIKDPIYEEIPDTPPPLPLSPPPSLDDLEDSKKTSRSIFEGASKYDILSYLVGAKERGIVPEESYFNVSHNGEEIIDIIDVKPIQEDIGENQRMNSLDLGDLSSRISHLSNASDSSEDSCNLIISNIADAPSSPNKVRKSSAEIERNDSGVGSETSKSSRSRWQHCGPGSSIIEDQQNLCEDCDQLVETQVTDGGVMFAPLVCRKCGKKRAERKEIIGEIVETEEKYGRDLQIIMEEFYRPMLVAGLLTPEQLSAIFLNVEELLEHNAALAEKLRDNLEIAVEQGDEDLLTVNIGKLFLEAAPMLHSFECYCIRQGAASLLLANLEKEKELLRIFLRVSQMENTVLRRMNLNSFLMVPVQRVTKYPLLLARLHKVTPAHHEGRELLKQAQHKIELHLEHMNSEAKDISTTKLWRRISIMNGRRACSENDLLNIKLRKVALDILEWNHDEVKFIMEGKLLYTNPADNNWRKSRTIKLNPINALLVINGKLKEDYTLDPTEESLMFPRNNGVREATLLLLKEKCGRYIQLREPLFLDKCIVCSETDSDDYFEVQELASRETFIFKAEDGDRTKQWYKTCQYIAQGMGAWRRRRNALANIMINGMQIRN